MASRACSLALEVSILSVDVPDQHIRHTRRFKIGVDGHQARHRIHQCHENILTLASFAIPPSLQILELRRLLETHYLTWTCHYRSACDLLPQPSHKQPPSRLFASQSLASVALFPTLTFSFLILRVQFIIGLKHPYMEQGAEHEPATNSSKFSSKVELM
jgi:hypothetical protein